MKGKFFSWLRDHAFTLLRYVWIRLRFTSIIWVRFFIHDSYIFAGCWYSYSIFTFSDLPPLSYQLSMKCWVSWYQISLSHYEKLSQKMAMYSQKAWVIFSRVKKVQSYTQQGITFHSMLRTNIGLVFVLTPVMGSLPFWIASWRRARMLQWRKL